MPDAAGSGWFPCAYRWWTGFTGKVADTFQPRGVINQHMVHENRAQSRVWSAKAKPALMGDERRLAGRDLLRWVPLVVVQPFSRRRLVGADKPRRSVRPWRPWRWRSGRCKAGFCTARLVNKMGRRLSTLRTRRSHPRRRVGTEGKLGRRMSGRGRNIGRTTISSGQQHGRQPHQSYAIAQVTKGRRRQATSTTKDLRRCQEARDCGRNAINTMVRSA